MLAEVKLACQRSSIPELAKTLGNVSEATTTWVDAPSIPFSCFRIVLRKKVSCPLHSLLGRFFARLSYG